LGFVVSVLGEINQETDCLLIDKIITLAKKYMTTPHTIKSTTVIEIDDDEDNV